MYFLAEREHFHGGAAVAVLNFCSRAFFAMGEGPSWRVGGFSLLLLLQHNYLIFAPSIFTKGGGRFHEEGLNP